MPEDKRDFIDSFFDAADSVADKMVSGAKHVHTPDKEYPETSSLAEVIASGAQSVASGTQSIMIGPISGSDGRGVFWHIFRVPTRTVCGIEDQPEMFWRPNSKSRAALLVCFGCLSITIGMKGDMKLLPEATKP